MVPTQCLLLVEDECTKENLCSKPQKDVLKENLIQAALYTEAW